MNIAYILFGYAEVFVESEQVLDLINLCMRCHLPYREARRASGGVCFIFRLSYISLLERMCVERGIGIHIRKRGGAPIWIYTHRQRYGMWAGIAAAIFLILFAQGFIWRIDVVGNESLTTSEILGVLSEHGLHAGSRISQLNVDSIQNRILIEFDEISWMSINIGGNTASVEIRERDVGDVDTDGNSPANLVASKGGRIEYMTILSGNPAVKSGDIVNEGDLLVGGIFDSTQNGYRLTRAEGKVYARTVEEIYIQIPYEYQKKVYTGQEYCDQYLNFFDFSIKIFKKGGNPYTFCDKIHKVNSLRFFDGEILPVSLCKDVYLEYEICDAKRSVEQAEELAYFELSQRLSSLSDDAVVVRKVIMPEVRDDFFALRCVIECIEDIAQASQIQTD